MKIETIKENRDYQKVNDAYIINRNEDAYRQALIRQKNQKRQSTFDTRLSLLEQKIDQIFNLLLSNK